GPPQKKSPRPLRKRPPAVPGSLAVSILGEPRESSRLRHLWFDVRCLAHRLLPMLFKPRLQVLLAMAKQNHREPKEKNQLRRAATKNASSRNKMSWSFEKKSFAPGASRGRRGRFPAKSKEKPRLLCPGRASVLSRSPKSLPSVTWRVTWASRLEK